MIRTGIDLGYWSLWVALHEKIHGRTETEKLDLFSSAIHCYANNITLFSSLITFGFSVGFVQTEKFILCGASTSLLFFIEQCF